MLLRLSVQDGDLKAAIDTFKAGFRMYPLADANGKEQTKFINLSGLKYNTIHANDATYFDELNAVIQYEPEGSYDAEILGSAAALGIRKGQAFEPDERMQGLLEQGAAVDELHAAPDVGLAMGKHGKHGKRQMGKRQMGKRQMGKGGKGGDEA